MINETRIFRGSPQYYERVRGISLGESELDFISLNMPPVCNYRCHFCLSGMNGRQRPQNSLTERELQDLIIEADHSLHQKVLLRVGEQQKYLPVQVSTLHCPSTGLMQPG